MKFVKYETIKRKAVRELWERCLCSGMGTAIILDAIVPAIAAGVDPRKLSGEWCAEAERIIIEWDIRRVKTLIECFPSCIPKQLHGQAISAEYDENLNWVVCFGATGKGRRPCVF